MICSQPINSPVSSKTTRAPFCTSMIEGAPDRRVGGDAARGIRTAADRADDEVAHVDRHARHRGGLFQRARHPRAPFLDRPPRAAGFLDDQHIRRPAGGADFIEQVRAVESFAARARRAATAPTLGCVQSCRSMRCA